MSVVMPYTPAQVQAWSKRGPEPIDLALPGWTQTVHLPPVVLPNERLVVLTRGDARIEMMRWWDRPLTPGHPMKIESTRKLAGHDVHTTSIFQGASHIVDLVFTNGADWSARIVFRNCSADVIEAVLTSCPKPSTTSR